MAYFIGLDMHRKYSEVCVMDQGGETQTGRRLYHEDEQEMVDFFAQFKEGTDVVLEATFSWMWISDILEALGLQVHLAHSPGVRLIADSRLKTDKIDARTLAQLLRTGFLPESYLAPQQVRDHRMLLRHRESMVCNRTAMKNRVHSLLARYNIHLEPSDIFGKAGMEMLKELDLPAHARRVMDDLLTYIEHANAQLERLERYLNRTMHPDPRVGWLESLPGVGKVTAHYLIGEIGDIDRFASPKKLVSYAGLCPTTRSSGGKTWHGSPRGGRRLLKWVMVEAAHTAVKRDAYFSGIFHGLKRRKGKKIAYVAVAHKMLKVIWHMLTEQRNYRPRKKQSQVGSS